MRRLKNDDLNRPVLSNYLVYEDGRFRKPGSSYILKRNLDGELLKSSVSLNGSRQGSRAVSRNGSVRSSANIAKPESGRSGRSGRNSALKSMNKQSFVFEKNLVGERLISGSSSNESKKNRVKSSSKKYAGFFQEKHAENKPTKMNQTHTSKPGLNSRGFLSGSNFRISNARRLGSKN